MVMLVEGRFQPKPFSEMLDPATGRTRVRLVDVQSEQYEIARRYMVRLRPEDLEEPESLKALAAVVHQSPEEFRRTFGYLVAEQPALAA
jgi:6-phosphofructokinase 1